MAELYYVHDLSSDKVRLYTNKPYWMGLNRDQQDKIKSSFVWAAKAKCWVSRAKGGTSRIWAMSLLRDLGFEDRGTIGERKTFTEQMTGVPEEVLKESDIASDVTPQTLASLNPKLKDPAFLARRIKEQVALENTLLRHLDGKLYSYSPPSPISEDYRKLHNEHLERVREKIRFYRTCEEEVSRVLASNGKLLYTKDALAGKTFVKVRGRWVRIVRLNPNTVSVYNMVFPEQESQRKNSMKYPYAEIEDARSGNDDQTQS